MLNCIKNYLTPKKREIFMINCNVFRRGYTDRMSSGMDASKSKERKSHLITLFHTCTCMNHGRCTLQGVAPVLPHFLGNPPLDRAAWAHVADASYVDSDRLWSTATCMPPPSWERKTKCGGKMYAAAGEMDLPHACMHLCGWSFIYRIDQDHSGSTAKITRTLLHFFLVKTVGKDPTFCI